MQGALKSAGPNLPGLIFTAASAEVTYENKSRQPVKTPSSQGRRVTTTILRLVVTSATILVTGALLVVTRSY